MRRALRVAQGIAVAAWVVTWPVLALAAGALVEFLAFFGFGPVVNAYALVIAAAVVTALCLAADVDRGRVA